MDGTTTKPKEEDTTKAKRDLKRKQSEFETEAVPSKKKGDEEDKLNTLEDKQEEKPDLKRKRGSPGEAVPSKKKKKSKNENKFKFDPEDDVPMKIPFEIRNGVRHLEPYWTVYRTRAKGRWFGRRLVDVFSQEFLSTNPHYAKVACRLGRIWVNGEQMKNVNYEVKSNDFIEHWGHRHEHPIHACGQYAVHSVLGQLRERYGRTGLRVLHRLDRTTSGVLMFAKDYETDREFKGTLKEGEWKKEYVCRVQGEFPEGEIKVDQPIGTLVLSMGIQCIRDDGKHAESIFTRDWTDGKISVVRVQIRTGRTHQIRVHLQYLGFPIVNDNIYNRPEIWPNGGKNAEYGMSLDELKLGKIVQAAHKASNWHEEVDPEYNGRMEKMARESDEELSDPVLSTPPDPPSIIRSQRPSYDPICLSCNVKKKEVPMSHFQIDLHCLQYETEKWSYSTPLPPWAQKPKDEEEEKDDVKVDSSASLPSTSVKGPL